MKRGLLFAVAVLLAPVLTSPATAQSGPGPAVELTAGWAGFVDDATIDYTLLGGTARWYVSPRLSVGPAIEYMAGPDAAQILFVTGMLVFDVVPARANRPVAFYVVADAGWSRRTDRVGIGSFTSHEGAFSGGGGLRFWLGDSLYLAPEVRIGWELHTRATVTLGFQWRE